MKKKYLNIILILVLTTIILYFVLKDNFALTVNIILNSNVLFLFFGFILTLGYCFFKSLILHGLISQFKSYSIYKTFKLEMMTFFFNAITPFSSGGEPFQIYTLKKSGVSVSNGTNVIMQSTILHQLSMIFLLVLALVLNSLLHICEINSYLSILLIVSFIINLLVLILLFVFAYVKKLDKWLISKTTSLLFKLKIVKDKNKTKEKWMASIDNFYEGSKSLFKDKKRFCKLLFFNVIGLMSLFIVPLVVLFSFNNYHAFDGITALVLTIFTSFISSFVPLPGATGGQEYLFFLLFGYYVEQPMLSSLLIMWRFLTYYLPMIVGALVFNFQKKE